MRSAEEMRRLILDKAENDPRIRAVLLNGSRANPKAQSDMFQDFDVVYLVRDIESFLKDHGWTDYFGPRIIWQLPDTMHFGEPEVLETYGPSFGYLMLFEDHNRIDLTLYPLEHLADFQQDSLTELWLDKDDLFTVIPPANDSDYWVQRPDAKTFEDVCNEFWWVSTYVAKGLARQQISYAKEMMEMVVRPMFMKMLAWKVGIDTGFQVSFGKAGKFMEQYLAPEIHAHVLRTYSDHQIEHNWQAMFEMMELFGELGREVANRLGFVYRLDEEENVRGYVKEIYES